MGKHGSFMDAQICFILPVFPGRSYLSAKTFNVIDDGARAENFLGPMHNGRRGVLFSITFLDLIKISQVESRRRIAYPAAILGLLVAFVYLPLGVFVLFDAAGMSKDFYYTNTVYLVMFFYYLQLILLGLTAAFKEDLPPPPSAPPPRERHGAGGSPARP